MMFYAVRAHCQNDIKLIVFFKKQNEYSRRNEFGIFLGSAKKGLKVLSDKLNSYLHGKE
jgi:hypothetical protein